MAIELRLLRYFVVVAEELHVGTRAMFAVAGFIEVSSPTLRRVVMRIDF